MIASFNYEIFGLLFIQTFWQDITQLVGRYSHLLFLIWLFFIENGENRIDEKVAVFTEFS